MVWNSLANANAWLPVCLNVGVLFFLCLPHSCLPQSKYSSRLVDTAYGSLRGIILPRGGNLAQDVEAFLGVPYASAPAASLRFMPPITPSHWKGVRLADKLGPVCPQLLPDLTNRSDALTKMPLLKFTRLIELSMLLSNQSEDCLYLNIFMPKRDERRPGGQPNIRYCGTDANANNPGGGSGGLAIVVILQGESWEWGSGNLIDGSALASHGHVMVITLNYRLGVLGFLQTSSQQGNFAIMDVVAALNWIRENAGAFGADVNRVTLLGHRTGAVLVNFLMLAPVATELFQRVILLSGSSLSPWSFQRHSKNNVRKLAQYLMCLKEKGSGGSFPTSVHSSQHQQAGSGGKPGGGSASAPVTDASADMGPCLRQVPLDQFLSAVTSQLLQPRFLARFGPLIDTTVVKSDFIAEMKIDKDGYFSSIPILIGTASVESFGELNTEDIEDGISELKRDRILRTFVRNVFVFHLNEIYSTIKNEYTDWEKPRKDFVDVRDSILNILSDGLTVAPLVQVANMHAKKDAKAKAFLFHFMYEADHSVYPNRIGSISEDLLEFSVGHALLNNFHNERNLPSYSTNDAKVSKSLVQYITNFIISGDPNSGYDGSSVEDAQLPYWDSYDPINQFYLEIGGEEPRMRSHYRGHKMALWLNLIPQLHQSGGSDVAMLHHNFREEKPEFYEGPVREQQKFAVTEEPPVFQPGGGNSGGGKEKPKIVIPVETEEDLDGPNFDYDNEGLRLRTKDKSVGGGVIPTLAPAVMSTSECPPNATNSTTIMGGGGGSSGKELGVEAVGTGGTGSMDRDLVRQLAAAHYHSYGTALGVTIGVGCCLLLLNLLIFLAIYHQKTHNAPTTTYQVKEPSPEDEENPLPLPTSLTRPRSHPDVRQCSSVGGSVSFPALYSDDGTDDEDIVQELRECSTRSSSFRMKNQECSSSSGFCSPSIPEPPPPPRMRNPSP